VGGSVPVTPQRGVRYLNSFSRRSYVNKTRKTRKVDVRLFLVTADGRGSRMESDRRRSSSGVAVDTFPLVERPYIMAYDEHRQHEHVLVYI
jgi:hypothetical protein